MKMKIVGAWIGLVLLVLMLSPNYANARKGGKRPRKPCRVSLDGCGRSRRPKPTIPLPIISSSSDNPQSSRPIACAPCSRMSCLHEPGTLRCDGGVVTGFCGCCQYCAKLEGESCGGRNLYLGKCGAGLTCNRSGASPTRRSVHDVFDIDRSRSSSPESLELRGTCRRGDQIAQPTPDPTSSCRPECSAEFCFSQPNGICSARNNAVMQHPCQGVCQHTSCKACFITPTPKCNKCKVNDFKCMRSFGRCVKSKSTCKKKKYPCKKRKTWRADDSFKCWVAEC
ncbi:uncharacterized protein LOC101242789 [Ciona intestinalis]